MPHRCIDIRGTTIVYRHRSIFPSILLSLHVRGRDENYILSFSFFFSLSITTRCVYVLEVRCAHPRTANRRFLLFSRYLSFLLFFLVLLILGGYWYSIPRLNEQTTQKKEGREREEIVVVVVSLCVGRYTGRSQRLT